MAGKRGGKRPNSGRKHGGKALLSNTIKEKVMEQMGEDFFVKFLKARLESADSKESMWAFEQLFGKALQSTELSGSVDTNPYNLKKLTNAELEKLDRLTAKASGTGGKS